MSPLRIVASAGSWLDALLAFGVQPVAYLGNGVTSDGLYAWERERIGGAVHLAAADATSLLAPGAIGAHSPDLLLLDPGFAPAQVDEAQAIATTVSRVEGAGTNDAWRHQVRALGELLGRDDEAAAILTAVDRRIADTRAAIGHDSGRTVLLGHLYDLPRNACSVLASAELPAVAFWRELGFSLPADVPARAKGAPQLDLTVEELTADYLNVLTDGASRADIAAALPAFEDLPAVRSGACCLSDLEQVMALRSCGPLSLHWLLDRLGPSLRRVR